MNVKCRTCSRILFIFVLLQKNAYFRLMKVLLNCVGIILLSFKYFGQIQQNVNVLFQPPEYIDETFGNNGLALFGVPPQTDGIKGIALQSNGKIVAVGNKNNKQFYVMRLNSDGSLDLTFGQNGIIEDSLIGEALGAHISVDQFDRIIVTGTVNHGFGQEDIFVVRTLPDGSYDNSFGVQGVFIAYVSEVGPGAIVKRSLGKKIRFLPDGSLLIGGGFSYQINYFDFAAFKITPNGQFDSSFGTNGYVYYNVSGFNSLGDITIQTDGKILLTGSTFNPIQVPVLRLNADGSLDSTFADNGLSLYDFTTSTQNCNSIKQLADGKIIVGGSYGTPSYENIFLRRLDENGLTDSSFANNGLAIYNFGAFDILASLHMLVNGDMLMLGFSDDKILLVCVDSNGVLKTDFGHNGKFLIDIEPYELKQMFTCIQADGKILLAGLTKLTFYPYLGFVRLDLSNTITNTPTVSKNKLRVYPNPASDNLNIFLPDDVSNVTCILNDNLGREVVRQIMSSGQNSLDIQSLEKGIYWINLEGSETKFIKN